MFWSYVSTLTTKATPADCPRSGGQGLRAANAIRYAAKIPPPTDRKPSPQEDLEQVFKKKNQSKQIANIFFQKVFGQR